MKRSYLIGLLLLIFALNGCFNSEYVADFDAIKEKATNTEGSSGSCPVGLWGTPTCSGNVNLEYNFGSDGNGYASNPNCGGSCTPLIFRFKYTVSGNTITYNFTASDNVTCTSGSGGKPAVPTGTFNMTFTCNSDGTLTTVTSNIQTGAKTTVNFTRK